jgi:hypothetical protein
LFWGINQTITFGSTTILNNGAGVVDTGTTLLLLATGMNRTASQSLHFIDQTTPNRNIRQIQERHWRNIRCSNRLALHHSPTICSSQAIGSQNRRTCVHS